jgi:hypothetical protein
MEMIENNGIKNKSEFTNKEIIDALCLLINKKIWIVFFFFGLASLLLYVVEVLNSNDATTAWLFSGVFLVLISIFVFIAFSFKAFGGAILPALIVWPPVLAVLSEFSSSSLAVAGMKISCDPLFGLPPESTYASFCDGFGAMFGMMSVMIFCVVGALSFQRACGSLVLNSSARNSLVAGAVSASLVVMTVNMLCFNIMSDVRIMALVWFMYGLCGSVYKVGKVTQYKTTEV